MRFLLRSALLVIILIAFSLPMDARPKFSPREKLCQKWARMLTTKESNRKDAKFFKICIVDYLGFRLVQRKLVVPYISSRYFHQSIKRRHLSLILKRVERFFIRNGNWYTILKKKIFIDPRTNQEQCQISLLYVVAAKYVYALNVLNSIRHELSCMHCKIKPNGYALRSRENVCYIRPKYFTCEGEIDIRLLGHKSGSLTALFNQFYKEPIGENRKVPGFKDDSDIVMGVKISAFSLEKALPTVFMGVDSHHNDELMLIVMAMKKSTNMKLLSLAVAIFRMKGYSAKYFNELLSDQGPLRAKMDLTRAFQHWSVELTSFESKIKSFMDSPHYNYELNYYRRHNIAFELVTGRLESSDFPSTWVSSLAEYAMCLIHNVPVYLTSGAVRHSVIGQDYQFTPNIRLDLDDYWPAMLENWANAVRTYKRECLGNAYRIGACLLRMSKSFYFMFDAMVKMQPLLLRSRTKVDERLNDMSAALAITGSWVKNYRNKGYTTLPIKVTAAPRKRPSEMKTKRPRNSRPSDEEIAWSGNDDFPELIELQRTTENGNKDIGTEPSPLTKYSKSSSHEEMLENDNDNTKPPGKNVDESASSQVETREEEKDGTSPEIDHSTPLSPGFIDMAESDEIEDFDDYRPFETPQTIEPLQVDVDAPTEAFVKRTLPQKDMEEEETAGSPMAEADTNRNMKDDEENSEDNAGASMTNAMDMNDNTQKSHSINEDHSMMKERVDNTVDASMTKLEKQDIEEPTKTEGSLEEKPLNKDARESVDSPAEKPLNKDTKESVDSPVEKPLNKDTKESVNSPAERVPLNTTGLRIGNKKKGRKVSGFFFRRRRRRRRFSFSRRRRFSYSRRRRRTVVPARVSKVKRPPRAPDETRTILNFLSIFRCSSNTRLAGMVMRENCMDKIQLRIRKYNRVAFAHFARRHDGAGSVGWLWELMRLLPNDDPDVMVKTEL